MKSEKADAVAGIIGVTRSQCRLHTSQDVPPGVVGVYGLPLAFQVSPTQGGLFVNIRHAGARCVDYELGVDAFVFDGLEGIGASKALAVARNAEEENPRTGKPAVMVRFPLIGGFVPLGAKRADGTPHPHAGTGFGLMGSVGFPVVEDLTKPVAPLAGDEAYYYQEILQFAYDGKALRVTDQRRLDWKEMLPGYSGGGGLKMAMPDGDDLLAATSGHMEGDPYTAGVGRWKRGKDGWRLVAYHGATGDLPAGETSLIRDVDGSLLLGARPGRPPVVKVDIAQAILVWRSRDNGATWEKIIEVPNIRNIGPVTLNQAADGSPYVAANTNFQAFIDRECRIHSSIGSSGYREIIALWPLNAERSGLLSPYIARWPRYEYGPPPHGGNWTADHPNATTVRLADGKWHNLLCYRMLEWAENGFCLPPTPWTGAYVEEVLSAGPERPLWLF